METKTIKKMVLVGLMLGANLIVRSADKQSDENKKEQAAALIQAACRGTLERQAPNTQNHIAQKSSQQKNGQKSQTTSVASAQSSYSASSDTYSDTSSNSDDNDNNDNKSAFEQLPDTWLKSMTEYLPLSSLANLNIASKTCQVMSEVQLKAEYQNLIRELDMILEKIETYVYAREQAIDWACKIMYKAQNNTLWPIQLLIDRGVNLEAAIVTAAQYKLLSAIQFLIDRGEDVNQPNFSGNTALIRAAEKGWIEGVKLLLTQNPNLEPCRPGCWTPLLLAISGGYIEVIQELINAGASLNQVNDRGLPIVFNVATRYAPVRNQAEIIQILIDAYCDQLMEEFFPLEQINPRDSKVLMEESLPLECGQAIAKWLAMNDILSLGHATTHCLSYSQREFEKTKQKRVVLLKEKLILRIREAIASVHPGNNNAEIIDLLHNKLEKIKNLNIDDLLAIRIALNVAIREASPHNQTAAVQMLIDTYRDQLMEEFFPLEHINPKHSKALMEQSLPLECGQAIAEWLATKDILSLRRATTHCLSYSQHKFDETKQKREALLKKKLITYVKCVMTVAGGYGKKVVEFLHNQLEKVERLNVGDLLAARMVNKRKPVCALDAQELSQNLDANIAGPAPKVACALMAQSDEGASSLTPKVGCAVAQARDAAAVRAGKMEAVLPACAVVAVQQQNENDAVALLCEDQPRETNAEARQAAIAADQEIIAGNEREYAESLAHDQRIEQLRQQIAALTEQVRAINPENNMQAIAPENCEAARVIYQEIVDTRAALIALTQTVVPQTYVAHYHANVAAQHDALTVAQQQLAHIEQVTREHQDRLTQIAQEREDAANRPQSLDELRRLRLAALDKSNGME